MAPERFEAAQAILEEAVASRAFPAAVVEVGAADRVLWSKAFGRLTYEAEEDPCDEATIFDLASLTKVIATATLVMQLVERGALELDAPVSRVLPDWRGRDREAVAIRDLLAHASGLTAYLPFFRDYEGRKEFEEAICALPLEYSPRSQSIYSDLGFILLGFIVEDVGGAPLARQFASIAARLGLEPLVFNPPRGWRARVAPTEVDPWRGRLLRGEVHDENCWALGGAAGHSGLFGTAEAVGRFARAVLQGLAGHPGLVDPDVLARFARPVAIPGSSRALAWDTMLPTSSCGRLMSPAAIGHTGFTGTSLWIDPGAGIYVVFLTNRVHPSRENERIRHVRPRLHDAIMSAVR